MDTYPGLGQVVEIDFGNDGPFGPFAAELTFPKEGSSLSFLVKRGSLLNKAETCEYRAVHVDAAVWMVSWREADGLTVVQVQDFASGRLWSAVTNPQNELSYLDGTIRILRDLE